MGAGGFGNNGQGYLTQTAGTVINRLVPPRVGAWTKVWKLYATAAGTKHTITAFRSKGRTTFTAAGASGQAVVAITAQPFATRILATNDLVAIRETDGVTRLYTVSSVSSLNITLTANLAAGVATASGANPCTLWFFGLNTDVDLKTGLVDQAYNVVASVQTNWIDPDNGVIGSNGMDEPILFQDSNGTAAGSIDQVTYGYVLQ